MAIKGTRGALFEVTEIGVVIRLFTFIKTQIYKDGCILFCTNYGSIKLIFPHLAAKKSEVYTCALSKANIFPKSWSKYHQ